MPLAWPREVNTKFEATVGSMSQPEDQPESLTPERTADGSMTLHSARFAQAYHSTHGATTESMHVFVGAGFRHATARGASALRILELGLGTGLNALLTLKCWRELPDSRRPSLEYVALEPHPIPGDTLSRMTTASDAGVEQAVAAALHARPEAEQHHARWSEDASFTRLNMAWQSFARGEQRPFDLIYFDAFAPDSQPELWTEERFREAYLLLKPGGTLVTYCAKGDVRRAMVSQGFQVEKLPGPPGKREMLRATRPEHDALPSRFNVRIYFFLLAGAGPIDRVTLGDRVLLSDEIIGGRPYTKWPGGGLEFGEGPIDCVQREALEELGFAIAVGPLVHATGSFVRSAFRPVEQVLCQYYMARAADPGLDVEALLKMGGGPEAIGRDGGPTSLSWRWAKVASSEGDALSFETDRAAWKALQMRATDQG